MSYRRTRAGIAALAGAAAIAIAVGVSPASAHHSFAMYDQNEIYVLTGVVTKISPDANHVTIFFAPLNEPRDAVVRDAKGEPVIWSVELRASSQVARDGVTPATFPAGTIFSIGLHPLRNGLPGGGRGDSGLFKCPPRTPPVSGKHCDSVADATSHGESGVLPTPTAEWAP